jgi:hypothetical protein
MRDIRASVEVRALIGAEKLRELHGNAFVRYECWQCAREGRTTEPTSVIVLAYRVFRVVRLAHAACTGSHIIGADAAMIGAAAGQTAAPQPRHQAGERPGSSTAAGTTRQGGAWREDGAAGAQAGSGR